MLHLTQTQRLQQKLSPAQVQYLKILQLPVLQLEQKIKDELEMNPLLEEGMEQLADIDEEPELEPRSDDVNDDEAGEKTEIETVNGEKEHLDKEIRENSTEEYSWEEFFENNEGSSSVNHYYDGDEDREIPTPARVTMREELLDQIQMLRLSDQQSILADAIIWNIDDDGYLHHDFAELLHDVNQQHDFEIEIEEAEDVLRRIQHLDPPGIASRDLRECLLVQLDGMPNSSTARIVAIRILKEAWQHFEKKHFDKIRHDLHISEEMLIKAFDIIKGLNPKPGESESLDSINYIIPDFFVSRDEGEFVITLNERGVPPLRVNSAYKNMLLNQRKKLTSETRHFLRQKMEAAKWFIQSIHQRRQTMLAVMSTIIEKQKDWFENGKGNLRPLIYKDIADDIGMDISTISRVVNGKYAQTEWGVFELRYYFSEGISTDSGEDVANKEVKAILQDIMAQENPKKPLSDQALTKILQEQGFNIARRTVAKYRESMGIPVSRLRKQLV